MILDGNIPMQMELLGSTRDDRVRIIDRRPEFMRPVPKEHMRVFIAVGIPMSIREDLALLRERMDGVRWIPATDLHLTLQFIGEVSRDTVDWISAAASEISLPSIPMYLGDVGAFPSASRPSVLWVGVHAGDILIQLQQRVNASLAELRLDLHDRTYTPHITLARIRLRAHADVRTWLQRNQEFKTQSFRVASYHLYSSELGPAGATYRTVATYPLHSDIST